MFYPQHESGQLSLTTFFLLTTMATLTACLRLKAFIYQLFVPENFAALSHRKLPDAAASAARWIEFWRRVVAGAAKIGHCS